jgi:hypothetical protein
MQVHGGLYDLLELTRNPFIPSPQIIAVGLHPALLGTINKPGIHGEVTDIMNHLKNNLGFVASSNAGSIRTSETIVIMDFDLYSQTSDKKFEILQIKLSDKSWDNHQHTPQPSKAELRCKRCLPHVAAVERSPNSPYKQLLQLRHIRTPGLGHFVH